MAAVSVELAPALEPEPQPQPELSLAPECVPVPVPVPRISSVPVPVLAPVLESARETVVQPLTISVCLGPLSHVPKCQADARRQHHRLDLRPRNRTVITRYLSENP
jgi:hypothetical protein